MARGVYVYAAEPAEIADVAAAAVQAVESDLRREPPFTWADPGVPGAFTSSPVLEQIDDADFLVADLTQLTFNISYQIGYAIGRRKPILITRNTSIAADD